uniref:Uncharacterized protein n=1 Tax=Oryza sativa subsp. japonica TaxID=39947 RepID=Q9AV03_ORYSJ|nr:unknown protein [Oryza sativa Japonica Group]
MAAGSQPQISYDGYKRLYSNQVKFFPITFLKHSMISYIYHDRCASWETGSSEFLQRSDGEGAPLVRINRKKRLVWMWQLVLTPFQEK